VEEEEDYWIPSKDAVAEEEEAAEEDYWTPSKDVVAEEEEVAEEDYWMRSKVAGEGVEEEDCWTLSKVVVEVVVEVEVEAEVGFWQPSKAGVAAETKLFLVRNALSPFVDFEKSLQLRLS